MKHYLIVACAISLAALPGCKQQSESNIPESQPENSTVTAVSIVESLKKSGLPVENITEITAKNDENELLGRPNQYISKSFFYDGRYPKKDELENPEHTVEVFATEEDAKARKDYVEQVTRGVPFLTQYQVLQGKVLLRMDKAMQPDEVKAYEAALKAL